MQISISIEISLGITFISEVSTAGYGHQLTVGV